MAIQQFKHLCVERDERGVATVTFDAGNRRVNVLDVELLSELETVLDDLEADAGVRLVVFCSAKESGFLVGADVHHIRNFTTAAEAEKMLLTGQRLLERVEGLRAVTVAVIHGPCLGGGLEFALACQRRVARDDADTFLGLPETQLGLIPGWGGTWRLPRTVGPAAAVRMILEGSRVKPRDAERIGLVDAVFDEAGFDEGISAYVESCLRNRGQGDVVGKPRNSTRLSWNLVLWSARLRILRRAKLNPALPAALRAMAAGLAGGMQAGLAREREEFCRILFIPECRTLLEGFFQRRG